MKRRKSSRTKKRTPAVPKPVPLLPRTTTNGEGALELAYLLNAFNL